MILAIDIKYGDNTAVVAGVSFTNWKDCIAKETYTSKIIIVKKVDQLYRNNMQE